MRFKKVIAYLTACVLAFGIPGCASGSAENKDEAVTIAVGFENSLSEPVGKGLAKFQEIVETSTNGKIRIKLYPDSELGSKKSIIDSMLLGEPVITVADGAFYAEYSVPDFGMVFGPFLFDSWEECWKLTGSGWYEEQCSRLEEKGLKIIGSNWIYGDRHILTTKPVNSADDLAGMRIRVPDNQIQIEGFKALGASPVAMDLDGVYDALKKGEIDGAENPLSTLYGRKLHKVAKYLILDGHVKNFTTIVMSRTVFDTLTKEQQDILISACREAGEYNNELQTASEQDYLQKMKNEGVRVVEPTPEVIEGFKNKARAFYDNGEFFGWSESNEERIRSEISS